VKVPGIGKKTAERLLLELKGKLGPTWVRRQSLPPAMPSRHPAGAGGLGYSDKEAALALKALPATWA
jgi:Holliday junction DNA helicase RuvA